MSVSDPDYYNSLSHGAGYSDIFSSKTLSGGVKHKVVHVSLQQIL